MESWNNVRRYNNKLLNVQLTDRRVNPTRKVSRLWLRMTEQWYLTHGPYFGPYIIRELFTTNLFIDLLTNKERCDFSWLCSCIFFYLRGCLKTSFREERKCVSAGWVTRDQGPRERVILGRGREPRTNPGWWRTERWIRVQGPLVRVSLRVLHRTSSTRRDLGFWWVSGPRSGPPEGTGGKFPKSVPVFYGSV